jgi:hypothetical protein
MRNLVVKTVVLSALLAVAGGAFGQPPPAGGKSGKTGAAPSKPAAPAVPALEEMLARALKDNPDIRVAETKVHETEAELNRVRLQVIQKAITFHTAWQAAQANVTLAQSQMNRINELMGRNAVSQEERQLAEHALLKAKSELAKLEAEVPYLLGQLPNQTAHDKAIDGAVRWLRLHQKGDAMSRTEGQLTRWGLEALAVAGAAPPAAIPRPMAEKIRKALDTPIKADYRNVPAGDILKHFKEKAPGVPFLVNIGTTEGTPVTLKLDEPVPLGAAMQALGDTLPGLSFAVREYGILVTLNRALPAGAVPLHDFWKGTAGADGDPSALAAKDALEDSVRGTITAVDAASGLVRISIGSDAGLNKGNTLEVFRVKPKPVYLGTITVIEVQAKEAVGKPLKSAKEPLRVGDEVAGKLFAR